MQMRAIRLLPAAAALLTTAGFGSALAAPPKAMPTTPPGITLVEVVRDEGGDQPVLLWYRPGDANGRTLFVFDQDRPGRATCIAECTQEFPALTAPRDARAFGDWSIVRRPDGSRQWAYQSHPLYSWVKENIPGDVASNVGVSERPPPRAAGVVATPKGSLPGQAGTPTGQPTAAAARSGPLLPPPGWQVARFTPAAVMSLPDSIDVRVVPSSLAVAFTDAVGMTLYEFDGDVRRDGQLCSSASCDLQWLPIAAPTLALPVGDFSIVSRPDGSSQWAYKGRPLYSYAGDQLPGDVHGAGVDKRWDVAVLTQDFRPANVAVNSLDGYGDVISLRGMTLYGSYMFEHRIGGRNQRDDFTHNSYKKGKELGPNGCIDAVCLALWHPFTAPADAQPDGWWEPITRPDGSKQWAYKGYAMYTYAGDKAAGDHSGQAVYDYVNPDGTSAHFQREMLFVNITQVIAGAGVYWNIAHP
jgi:predicted lipoprotein with Yx(FWY)xxD motif